MRQYSNNPVLVSVLIIVLIIVLIVVLITVKNGIPNRGTCFLRGIMHSPQFWSPSYDGAVRLPR